MAILYNGVELQDDKNILLDKWKLKSVTGDEKACKPGYCVFNNTSYALDMLHRHVDRNSRMVFHTDVDVDGVGTTYIFKKTLDALGSNNHLLLINKEKEHGIKQKHADYFKHNKIDLMIITDSSCNEIDIIKQFECDVLVVDHHDLLHNDLYGLCNDGIHHYVIVNNTIANNNQEQDNLWLKSKNVSAFNNLDNWVGDSDMSCGLVIYELLRLYCVCFANEKLMENLMLYQWSGITLFTDAINTLNDRNQYYLDNTVFSQSTEHTLNTMMRCINKFKASLDKTYIQYSFAPIINKAIRAGKSAEALDIVINSPDKICDLNTYKQLQQEAIEKATTVMVKDPLTGLDVKSKIVFRQGNIMLNISNIGVGPNYAGVIASRLCGDNNKNAAVYTVLEDGTFKGSFRGRYNSVDYRKYFDDYSEDIYAQGHPAAFGFILKAEQLVNIMNTLDNIEPLEKEKPFITIGNMTPEEYGVYHVTDIDEFKRNGYLWKIATGNSKVNSKDEICLRVRISDVKLVSTKGKTLTYDVLGMQCKAFEVLTCKYCDIYIELTNAIEMFIKPAL